MDSTENQNINPYSNEETVNNSTLAYYPKNDKHYLQNKQTEDIFKNKYEQFNQSFQAISDIILNLTDSNFSIEKALISTDEHSLLSHIDKIYKLIKSNSNSFNFTKNILNKLDTQNFFDEILIKILPTFKKCEKNYTSAEQQKNFTFFLLIFIKFKIKSRVNIFEFFGQSEKNQTLFKQIFEDITNFKLLELDDFEREIVISFFILCYQNLEIKYVAQNCLKYISFFLWIRLSKKTIKKLLLENEKHIEKWKILIKLHKKENILNQKPSFFFNDLIEDFLNLFENQKIEDFFNIDKIDLSSDMHEEEKSFLFYEKFIEFIIDLLTQISTRKFILPLLKEKHFLERLKISKFYLCENNSRNSDISPQLENSSNLPDSKKTNFTKFQIFRKMVDNLKEFFDFEYDENTHENISYEKLIMIHYEEINKMQALAFELFPDKISKFYLKTVNSIDNRENLLILLENLTDTELLIFLNKLNLLNDNYPDNFYLKNKILPKEIFVTKFERKNLLLDTLMQTPLYPNEKLLFDNDLIPLENNGYFPAKDVTSEDFPKHGNYFVNKPYPVPKLNLQFLTNFDYLYRNFLLFKFESTYEIREDIRDVINRIHPEFDTRGNLKDFNGWSRMAVPIKAFKILSAKKPKIGKKFSEEIFADIEFNLNGIQPHIKNEWDKIKRHDILFLLTFQARFSNSLQGQSEKNESNSDKKSPKDNLEIIKYIRGCEVNFLYDTENNEISEIENLHKKKPTGLSRRIQVALDGIQYNQDLKASENNIEEIYSSFHLLVRRKPKENNFRAILETIRDLMNETTIIPKWMENIFLGFGDPNTADYRKINNNLSESKVDFYDTFIDQNHFTETVLENNYLPVEIKTQISKKENLPKFLKLNLQKNPNHVYEILKKIDRLETIKLINSPNPYELIRKNTVRFTKKQIEAIVSGLHPGLTTVVGPPGTGKTDVAVQIVSLIYHNYPNQRTLVVTHSNTALNDIFEKISKLDINERYLLRLGIGEKELFVNLDKDFSRYGRINFMLERRLDLMSIVLKLANSINVFTHEEYTCENAILFYEFHIKSRIIEFKKKISLKFSFDFEKEFICTNEKNREEEKNDLVSKDGKEEDKIKFLEENFPFVKYCQENFYNEIKKNSENFIFDRENNFLPEIKKANTLLEYIEAVFTEISEVRAFELLRNNNERGNYLLTKQAKVIAMTCTHAALKRREFLRLGFEYDNIIVEEAAQILEVETFIPLLLQSSTNYKQSRLKRVILIGDDNQLPPIVKHSAYKNYSKLDQSLFNRFIRTGIPYVKLDAQGRMRPVITDLFRWRYPELIDLNCIKPNHESNPPHSLFNFSNPGFLHEFQFINLKKDSELNNEFCPIPHFYQNLAEAEYIVALYMYMCIQGYNPEKITILTTYNGQKALIKDIIKQKCSWNPFFKNPKKITTVDRYQGQQNDYILLSLVRTRYPGHLRDIRRLIVSLSRAKLGLYVFGSWDLFSNCIELKETFDIFKKKPLDLNLVISEMFYNFPNIRKFGEETKSQYVKIADFKHMYRIVNEMVKIRNNLNLITVNK